MSTEKPSPNDEKDQEKLKDPETAKNLPLTEQPEEKGGFENRAEPTRYGDWEVGGRCSDF